MTILITGVRAPVAVEIGRALHRYGHRIIAADSGGPGLSRWNGVFTARYEVPSPRLSPDAFFDAVSRIVGTHRVDLVIPTCEEIFAVAGYRHRFPAHCEVFTDDQATLLALHDKGRFLRLAATLGLPTPATGQGEDGRWRARLVELEGGGPTQAVMKRRTGRFGSQVYLVSLPLSDAWIERTRTEPGQWLLQRRLVGREISTFAVAREGSILAHVSYSALETSRSGGDRPFGAAIGARRVECPEATDAISRVVEALAFSGQIGVDLIRTTDGTVWPLECNPRATSGVHFFAERTVRQAYCAGDRVPAGAHFRARRAFLHKSMALPLLPMRGTANLAQFLRARDPLWDPRYPGAWFSQFPLLAHLRRVKGRYRLSTLKEASTIDIEWNR